MASNQLNLKQLLEIYCHTFEELESYVLQHGIDPNHHSVVERRNELFSNQQCTDADMYRFLMYCCSTLDDINQLITNDGLDVNDPAVIARKRELEVRCTLV